MSTAKRLEQMAGKGRRLSDLLSDGVGGGEKTTEEHAANNLNELQQGFKDRAKKEEKRFELATDSEYWFCVCFQSRAQKDAFLQAMNLFEHGDKYLDGQVVARRFGVELPDERPTYAGPRLDKRLSELT